MTYTETIRGQLVDIHNQSIYPAEIRIQGKQIISIEKKPTSENHFIIPGFIDAHVHIESSMLPPSEFARLALPHGTVATVSDPHEIANVLGILGIEYMQQNAKHVPLKFYFGAPSCVPSTAFETSGAILGPEEIEKLFQNKEIKFLSEVMNFPGVIHADPDMMAKIALAKQYGKKIDGHAPQVRGQDLKTYIDHGIQTDHESISVDEAREKISLGMKILIREGSAARNFDDLYTLMEEFPDVCMLCTDDFLPGDLQKGHINLLVARAVKKGIDMMKVLRCACWNPIVHYGLETGALRVNDPADFLIIKDLKNFEVLNTYIDGQCVAKNNKALFPQPPVSIINYFLPSFKKPSDFEVIAQEGNLKVIEAIDGQLVTNKLLYPPLIKEGKVVSDPSRDILKIAVVNRYADKPPFIGFIKNFGLTQGALASSIAHDSHNIIAIGVDDEALTQAVNAVVKHKGGIAIVDKELFCLPLPIAGLMSNQPGEKVAEQLELLTIRAQALGCTLKAPFMTLSFMALLVIPQLKISDLGLFDEQLFGIVPLFEPNKLD